MARSAVTNIPDGDEILRYVSPSRIRRDEENRPIGILFAAFKLRPAEAYLSAGWLDFYVGTRPDRLKRAVSAYDASPLKVKPTGGFAIGLVARIKEAGQQFGQNFRIVHEPTKGLGSYVAVRQYRDSEHELLDLLASEAWAELVVVADI